MELPAGAGGSRAVRVRTHFLLASLVGGLLAAGTDPAVADRSQPLRIGWYPGWGLLVSLPLLAVLSIGGDPVGNWAGYPLLLGSALGIGREISRW